MEEAEVTTYEPLDRPNVRHNSIDDGGSGIQEGTHVPKDQKHAVYLALMAAGIGFVLPYNSFIIAADYWQARFPGQSVALDMSMTYIVVAFATVVLNNVFLTLAPFRVRVLFGYIISFTTLIFVAIFEVAWHLFSSSMAYSVNLAAVSLVAIGCTVQQSSFYGFASMFPKQYTQAVMAGESIAGFLVSSNRVVTKMLIQNDRVSTVIFFLTSTLYILFSYLLHLTTIHSPFVRYHMKACARIVLRPDENRLDNIYNDGETDKYGVLSVDSTDPVSVTTTTTNTNNATNSGLSFSNPVYELSNLTMAENMFEDLNNLTSDNNLKTNSSAQETRIPRNSTAHSNVAFKVEHVISPETYTSGKLNDFKAGFTSRWRVAQAIYPYMVCIALTYCVTLSLYPGIESEIISCNLSTWLPVLLMFAFNTADVIGKILAAVPYPWSRRQLILMSGLRIVLVPLLLLCCAPRHQPVISGEAAAFVFTIALGISNGLAGSLPMMLAPAKVPATLKEVTGNMMTLSYNVGLTAGSLIGYVFESMLGPQLVNPCPTFPYASVAIHNQKVYSFSTTTTSTASTMLTPLVTQHAYANKSYAAMATEAVLTTAITKFFPLTNFSAAVSAAAAPTTTYSPIGAITPTLATEDTSYISSTLSSSISSLTPMNTTNATDVFNAFVSTTFPSIVTSLVEAAIGADNSTKEPQTPMQLIRQI